MPGEAATAPEEVEGSTLAHDDPLKGETEPEWSESVVEFEAWFSRLFTPALTHHHPARFGGWFQPWTVALIVGLPTIAILVYRRRDLVRAWRLRSAMRDGKDGP